ncbi:uncharacterized protein PGTG_15940 [Puccinia graminis f. sp. tritici CRL 75-36-700-3]|uniref:Uncharacterized protein n=1 Tax=Puccinia graminis f. sp. tritici (strain CRL 75-36-700-3 / race SCCL) TaxID=418459 RepID=E3L0N8_PUCGT|nr:uncharacterized protein PGTG_15940 [Puccinia graminis f. sp. tritici CRL 75-36-700-3]EFP90092.1 hypothetical protein PGTG_15940 [Puccinia graminis f. sp. tritici CRL 75-36-700-3]
MTALTTDVTNLWKWLIKVSFIGRISEVLFQLKDLKEVFRKESVSASSTHEPSHTKSPLNHSSTALVNKAQSKGLLNPCPRSLTCVLISPGHILSTSQELTQMECSILNN